MPAPKLMITDLGQIPQGMSSEDEADFWDSHMLSLEFLESATASSSDDSDLPPKRRGPDKDAETITIRIDADALVRLQKLADREHKGYQTLAKQFLLERLFEEERKTENQIG